MKADSPFDWMIDGAINVVQAAQLFSQSKFTDRQKFEIVRNSMMYIFTTLGRALTDNREAQDFYKGAVDRLAEFASYQEFVVYLETKYDLPSTPEGMTPLKNRDPKEAFHHKLLEAGFRFEEDLLNGEAEEN